MTLALYLGTASEITARLAGAPSGTTTTIAANPSLSSFELTSATSFSEGQSIVVNGEKRIIEDLTGVVVTLRTPLSAVPSIGDAVRHYDANYTSYRNTAKPLVFTEDLKTGGQTGDAFGSDIEIIDRNGNLAEPQQSNRVLIVDTAAPDVVLFSGVIASVQQTLIGIGGASTHCYGWIVQALGYTWEADALGIEESPAYNVNAGRFLKELMAKYTTLEEGEIDITSSPTVDVIRLSNYRRFSSVGAELAARWPGAEFFIENGLTNGKVYFRQSVRRQAAITLNKALIRALGPDNCRIVKDYSKQYNIVRFPFYKLTERDPDYFVQSTVVDDAFLKSSVVLSGQPASVEESDLLFDDFSDGELDPDYVEDDLTNPSPPTGYTGPDGFMVEGDLNGVVGLHLLDASGSGASLGDVGRLTDAAETEPFTGAERQMLYIREMVISQAGDCLILGITDQTTRTATVQSGSTGSAIIVDDASAFAAGDRIDVEGAKTYVSSVAGSTLNTSPSVPAPSAGDTVTLHRLAKSRIKFGLLLKANGDLKYIKNGVETAFATPRTYTASPTTYSFRIFMQAFETTVAASPAPSATGCELADAAHFATGDVVELYTLGSHDKTPEKRLITKSGSGITYADTSNAIKAGYRVRSLPKIVVQVKGGAYGDITGRDWTTIHEEANTWQTSASSNRDDMGIVVAENVSLVGTIPLFQLKDPPGVTANVGSRLLHIGTQDVDSGEQDVDCVLRKLGSHYQLDFFPDTKALWSSGSTLELRYQERFRFDLIEPDSDFMRAVAQARVQALTGNESEDELIRLGGRVLDTVQILPTPMTIFAASNQARAILDVVKNGEVNAEIITNTQSHGLVRAGEMIPSQLPGISDLEVKRVVLTEIPGARKDDGSALFGMRILAGSIDRLSDVLLRREIKNSQRLVLDDGYNDDTFTLLRKVGFSESAVPGDAFEVTTCDSPSNVVFDGVEYAGLACLRIIP